MLVRHDASTARANIIEYIRSLCYIILCYTYIILLSTLGMLSTKDIGYDSNAYNVYVYVTYLYILGFSNAHTYNLYLHIRSLMRVMHILGVRSGLIIIESIRYVGNTCHTNT